MTPAASMRRDEGKSKKEKGKRAEETASGGLGSSTWHVIVIVGRLSFLPFAFLLFPSSLLCSEVHQSRITITANGMPRRKPRCVTSRLVIEFPQRQAFSISGRIVYECGRCRRTWKTPPSTLLTSSHNIVQPKPPFRRISKGVTIAAVRLRTKRCP